MNFCEQCRKFRDEELARYERYCEEKIALLRDAFRQNPLAASQQQIDETRSQTTERMRQAVRDYERAVQDIQTKRKDRYPEAFLRRLESDAQGKLQDAVDESRKSIALLIERVRKP